jgi:hypothetical protein
MYNTDISVKNKISLKKLAENLTPTDISNIILHMANSNNINSEFDKETRKQMARRYSEIMYDINEELTNNANGFIVRKAFPLHWKKRDENMDAMIELYRNSKGVKRKYLKIDYYGVIFLESAGFITIENKNEDFSTQILVPTEKYMGFFEEREDNNKCFNFDDTTSDLVILLIRELFPDGRK